MPKLPSFPIRKAGSRWSINLPPCISKTGRRQRLFFDTWNKASEERKRRLGQFKQHGATGKVWLTAAEAEVARDALDRLAATGATLTAVVDDFLEKRRAADASCTIAQAFALFGETKGKARSESYLADVDNLSSYLLPEVGDEPVGTIDHGRLSNLIRARTRGGAAFNCDVRTLRAVLGLAVKKGKAKENPAKEIDLDEIPDRDPCILLPDQASAVMLSALREPDTVPAFALMLFCGVRPEEVTRLQWRHVNTEGGFVQVPGGAAKTRRTRYVPIHQTAAQWLALSDSHEPGDWIAPPNWKRKRQAVRRSAGIADLVDVLRHTFASAFLAGGGTMEALMLAMGHTARAVTLQHYVNGMLPRHALEFWKLTPDKVKSDAKAKSGKAKARKGRRAA